MVDKFIEFDLHIEHFACLYTTLVQENFVVEKFLQSSKTAKIKHTKYSQHAWYVIEQVLIIGDYKKFLSWTFYTRIIPNTKISRITVVSQLVALFYIVFVAGPFLIQ